MKTIEAIQRLRQVIRRQHKALSTESCHRVDALRAKRPAQMCHAPTISETQALLHAIQDEAGYPTNLIARML